MLNILKEMLRQTVRDKVLFGCGIYLLVSVSMVFIGDPSMLKTTGSEAAALAGSFLSIMLPIIAGVITSRACGTDLRDKTANYELLFGKKRSQTYFGRFLAALICVFALTALIPLLFVGIMTLFNGWGGSIAVSNALLHFGMIFPIVFRIVCFFTALTFFAGNDLVPFAISIIGTMVLILSTSLIALSSVSGFSFSWQTAATDLMTLLDFSNTTSGFLDGQDITIYKAFLSGGTVLRMLCTSFGIGLCWLLGGFAFFRKRDIS